MNEWGYVYLDIRHPIVAWMVYRGTVQSSDQSSTPGMLSFFAMNTLRRHPSAMLVEREGRFEGARQFHCPEKLSRLTSVFAYPDLASAEEGARQGHFKIGNLAAIMPKDDNFRREVYDSAYIDNYSSLMPDQAARDYWVGITPGSSTHREMLLSGSFFVLGTKLREQAKKVIWALGKEVRLALEISRLAAALGSDIGSVYPIAEKNENDANGVIRYLIRWDDNECADLVRQAMARFEANPNFYLDLEALAPLRAPAAQRDSKMFGFPDFRGKLLYSVSQQTTNVMQAASFDYVSRQQAAAAIGGN